MARRRINGVVYAHAIARDLNTAYRCLAETTVECIRTSAAERFENTIEKLVRALALKPVDRCVVIDKPTRELVADLNNSGRRKFRAHARHQLDPLRRRIFGPIAKKR